MSLSTDERFRLGVVILAAGRSSRMGRPKVLLPWGNITVLEHLAQQWQRVGATQVAVITAGGDAVMKAELQRMGWAEQNRIENPRPEQGMFSSIQCAARWTGWRPGLTHWAIALGDQPHLRLDTLASLLEFSRRNADSICQPTLQGRPRHPVILPGRAFRDIPKAQTEMLSDFLSRQATSCCEVEDPGLGLDMDTPADYQKLHARFAPGLPERAGDL